MERWMVDLCRAMPKVELHLHLDGALRPKTALDLAAARQWRGFEAPLSYRQMHRRLVVPHALASQEELLSYFETPGLLLNTREALRRVTRELVWEKAADHVCYCEIRWAPQLHTAESLSVRQVVETVLEESAAASRKTGVVVRLIAVGMRTHSLKQNLQMLEEIAPFAGKGLAAVDFAGPEAKAPDALEQEAFFLRARELGFEITFHCGELPGSAPRLAEQIMRLGPRRVAHGAGSAEDPALCALLRERDVMLDLCPTSNLQAGLYPDYQSYPLPQLMAAGVPVSISTDDPVLSDLSLSDEYLHLLGAGQVDLATLWQLNLDALVHAFLEEAEKARLLAWMKDWASNIPELKE
jgi:adenosine deaminase